jgi:hypothetical protein
VLSNPLILAFLPLDASLDITRPRLEKGGETILFSQYFVSLKKSDDFDN